MDGQGATRKSRDFATQTRYDIAHALARLGQFCEHPTEAAYKALIRVVAYLKGTVNKSDARGTVNETGEGGQRTRMIGEW